MKKGVVLDFSVIFEPEEKGGYSVYVPELPGCVTQGKNFEHARAMAKEAILAYIETAQENDIVIASRVSPPVMSTISIDSTELYA